MIGGTLGKFADSSFRNYGRHHSTAVRWGILSAGKISSDFVKAIAITEGVECTAVAARSKLRATEFAKTHGLSKSYGSYDELLSDPSIDIVYVGSIADQHGEMAKKCLLAGKPTVVEKPLTLSEVETRGLVRLAEENKLLLVEGMWTRFFPAMEKVQTVIASGDIGTIVSVQGDFGWNNQDCPYPQHRIWNPHSGGMTMDVGMYIAQLGQVAYPHLGVKRIHAMATRKHQVDQTVLVNVQYSKCTAEEDEGDKDGAVRKDDGGDSDDHDGDNTGMLQFYITGAANTEERVTIQGTRGRIVIDPPAHVPTRVRVVRDAGRTSSSEEQSFDYPLPDDSYTTWNYPGSIGFTYEVKVWSIYRWYNV